MSYIGGVQLPLTTQSGTIAYKAHISPPSSNNLFFVALGNSGVDPEKTDITGMHFLAISGQSGKLYDNQQNYIHSYQSNESFYLKGLVFEDYYNYFINDNILNVSGVRRTGEINSFYFSGLAFNNFSLSLSKPYQIPEEFL